MSYEYAGTLFRSAAEARRACVNDFLTTLGTTPVTEVITDLQSRNGLELAIQEAVDSGWRFVYDDNDPDRIRELFLDWLEEQAE